MQIDGKQLGSIFLAPMAGVTDVGFRHVCKMAGADLTFTEMVSAKALSYNSEKTKELLTTSPLENPKAVQIFGHEPEVMANACKMPELEKFDIIDINFGCPAPKIVNNGDGSALLKDLDLLGKIVLACTKATTKPISCKFRKGFLGDQNTALDTAKVCEDNGAKMITIHGRTRSQMYSGKVDLETIAKVKSSVKINVVGNGDIVDEESYKQMLATGVDAVMIGRGALGNPNIFALLNKKPAINKFSLLKEHINMLRNFYPEKFICATTKKHLLWYLAGVQNASKIKNFVANSDNLDECLLQIQPYLK